MKIEYNEDAPAISSDFENPKNNKYIWKLIDISIATFIILIIEWNML